MLIISIFANIFQKQDIMKRILLFVSILALTLNIKAQTITSLSTSDPILCFSGQGEITAIIDNPTGVNYLYNLEYMMPNGTFSPAPGSYGIITMSSSSSITFVNLSAAMYRLQLYNALNNSPTFNADHMLSQPLQLQLDPLTGIDVTDVSCNNGNDGSITINMTGGTTPYNYTWTGTTQTTQTVSNLTQGTYSVTIDDDNGCVFSGNPIVATVNQPLAPITYTYSTIDVDCHGNSTGEINIGNVSGGTAPYSFSWTGPNGFTSTDPSISNLPVGGYNLTITDNNSCTQYSFTGISSTPIDIFQPSAPLDINGIISHVNCFGDSDGLIDVTTSGGTPNYTWSWSDNNGNTYSTEDLNNISEGTYDLTVTDDNNCTETENFIVTEPNLALSSSVTVDDATCFSEDDGLATITVAGGTLPYIYSWSNGSNTDNTGLTGAGPYNITVTDSNGCVLSETANIGEPNEILATFVTIPISCPSGGDGEIQVNVTGGTPSTSGLPYIYSWSGTGTFQNVMQSGAQTETIIDVFDGTYTVQATDINGCFNDFSQSITEPLPLQMNNFNIQDVTCFGGNNGIIDPNLSGGTPPYTYSWSNFQTTSTLSNLSAGTYILTAQDNNN